MNYKQQIKDNLLKIWGREPQDLDDLAECCIAVLNSQPAARNGRSNGQRVKVVGLRWDIRFQESVSNTHECPIDGVTNWGGRTEGAPRGYPGWMGRVWVRYADKFDGWSSDPLRATLTYPGTGGFGGYNGPWERLYHCWYEARGRKRGSKVDWPEPQIFSWDYRFFQQDFPALGALRVWDILADRSTDQRHAFFWGDPETQAQDQEFLNRFGGKA